MTHTVILPIPDTDRLTRRLMDRGIRPVWITASRHSDSEPTQRLYDLIGILSHPTKRGERILAIQIEAPPGETPYYHPCRGDIVYLKISSNRSTTVQPILEMAEDFQTSVLYVDDGVQAPSVTVDLYALFHWAADLIAIGLEAHPRAAVERVIANVDAARLLAWDQVRRESLNLLGKLKRPGPAASIDLYRAVRALYPAVEALPSHAIRHDRTREVLVELLVALFDYLSDFAPKNPNLLFW